MDHYYTHEGNAAREFVTTHLPRGCDWPEVKDRVEKVKVMASEFSDSSDDRYEIIASMWTEKRSDARRSQGTKLPGRRHS
jgi:hypothetical protein